MAERSVFEQQRRAKPRKGTVRLIQIAGTKSILLFAAGFLGLIAVGARMTPFITVYLMVRELLENIGNVQGIDIDYVKRLGWITMAGIGAFGLLTYAAMMLSHIAAYNILFEIRTALAAKLARLPLGYFNRRGSGGIKKVLSDDVERIELFVAHHITDVVQAIALPLLSFIFLFIIDWRLAVGALLPIPLALMLQASMYGESGKALYAQWQKKLESMNGTIVEYVRGMPVVKIFNQTVSAFKRFADDVYAYRDFTLQWCASTRSPFSGFLTLLSSSALFVLPIGIFLVRDTSGSVYVQLVSTIFLFLFIGLGVAAPLYNLMAMSSLMTQNTTGLALIDEILDEPEMPDTPSPKQMNGRDIEFRGVSFSYEEKTVLHDVSFTVPQGSVTALVGPSGGGKTTIANLIGRFWDPDSGSIHIGGADIRDIPVEGLNDAVAGVFQDVSLFFDTIEANIRMGNDSAPFDAVVSAARAARIHDFIETLPQGYATLIGEGGTYLSGGEQQRISIARAILKDAPIVVLDEATAYADPENEARIQEALSVVLQGKTVVIIAHRLYTITDVDQILVIDGGRVVESGTHQALLNRTEGGLYRRMWEVHAAARNWNIDIEAGVPA